MSRFQSRKRLNRNLTITVALICAAAILCFVIFAVGAASAKAISPNGKIAPAISNAPDGISPNTHEGAPSLISPNDADINFWSDYPADILADALISRMTDEEIYAQILMFGWSGAEPSDLLNQWVLDMGLGNVKIFGWNTDDTAQVARSVNALQQKAQSRRFKIPLYVATDQEGGWIRHVKGSTTITPGNMAIGASGYPVDAWKSGYYISRELRALGINMNFAPTVDLYTNLDSTVIGPRSFGDNADIAGVLGASFAAGSLAAGVLPTAKHFPGHGDTGIDSHGKLPIIDIDVSTLYNRELVPFKHLIDGKIPAIMSAHLSFPLVEPLGTPSSLSKKFLTDILRGDLGFEGLIITDDIMMNSAALYAGSVSAAVRLAIEAGNDIVISSTTAHFNEALWRNNITLMKTNPEFRERVLSAARRVLFSKLNYFKSENHVPLFPDIAKLHDLLPDREGQEFFLSQACRSITAAKGVLPYKTAPGEHILLAGQWQFSAFFSEGSKRYPDAQWYRFPYQVEFSARGDFGDGLVYYARNYDTVIICVADDTSAYFASRLRSLGNKIIILSVLSPVPVFPLDWADTILYAYSYSPHSFNAAFGALAGEFVPQGTLPLRR